MPKVFALPTGVDGVVGINLQCPTSGVRNGASHYFGSIIMVARPVVHTAPRVTAGVKRSERRGRLLLARAGCRLRVRRTSIRRSSATFANQVRKSKGSPRSRAWYRRRATAGMYFIESAMWCERVSKIERRSSCGRSHQAADLRMGISAARVVFSIARFSVLSTGLDHEPHCDVSA